MTIEAALSKEQLTRLSILRHLQRGTFYFYALTCAVLSAYSLVFGPRILLLVAWVPFILYLAAGIFGALRATRDENHPALLSTQYKFDKTGIALSNSQGQSVLGWEHFTGWKVIAACYTITLKGGSILAIPQSDIPPTQVARFEGLLDKHIA